MEDDYYLAGEIVRDFLTIGNVARAMILEGMKESVKQTFGEEAVELFGEPSFSEETTTTKKTTSKKIKAEPLKWDSSKKGGQINISPDGKSIATGPNYVSWNCVLSENIFSEGVHYVEVYLDQVENGYLFYGVGEPSNLPWDGCISGSNSCLVVGYDARFTSRNGIVQHSGANDIGKFTRSQFVGLLIDQDKKELSIVVDNKAPVLIYSNLPNDCRIMCCIAHKIVITFTKHIVGKSNVEKYLKNPDTKYTSSDWVNGKK